MGPLVLGSPKTMVSNHISVFNIPTVRFNRPSGWSSDRVLGRLARVFVPGQVLGAAPLDHKLRSPLIKATQRIAKSTAIRMMAPRFQAVGA